MQPKRVSSDSPTPIYKTNVERKRYVCFVDWGNAQIIVMRIFLFLLLFSFSTTLFSQDFAVVKGVVNNEIETPVRDVNVSVAGNKTLGTVSNLRGEYELKIPANKKVVLVFSSVEYQLKKVTVRLNEGEVRKLDVKLNYKTLGTVTVEGHKPTYGAIERWDHSLKPSQIATPAENLENTLQFSQFGVSQNNELSAGYNVRGGNFNENLVYVNGIEVYRPFLARSGQQEGLSFVNPYLVDNILFSAGGFNANYGDKLSSVLDITYREPKKFKGAFTASLLGAAINVEDTINRRSNFIMGVRYRTNAYLLGALDTKGDYKPTYVDFQGMYNYYLNENLKLTLFGTYSSNTYNVIPKNRETNYGSINQALRFTVFYEGQEVTQFNTYMGAAKLQQNVTDKLTLNYITSTYNSKAFETFDLLGEYKLDELERDLSKDTYGDVAFNRGVGAFLRHARNKLDATVSNISTNGNYYGNGYTLSFGAKVQHEEIKDKLNEWKYLDSARFNIPHPADSVGYVDPTAQEYQFLDLSYSLKSKNNIQSNRLMGYAMIEKNFYFPDTIRVIDSIQTSDSVYAIDTTFESSRFLNTTFGIRANHWTYNGQTVFSPRFNVTYKPAWFFVKGEDLYRRNVSFRFATGFYYQPPFYRELRNLAGELNPQIRAQKSIHFVLGSDYTFFVKNRPFKLGAEIYYKIMTDVIPYKVDNVRIRYYGKNNAKAYAKGIDIKVNGEFVKGIESYASISYLKTEEDILDDYYYKYYNAEGKEIIAGYTADNVAVDSAKITPGYIPRPTDQRVNFSLFFQDKMPEEWNTPKMRWSTFKVNLTMVFGSRLPYGPPGKPRYADTLRTPFYRRVDIGFSKDLIGDFSDRTKFGAKSVWNNVDKMWISLEVFNLLDISNTINYTWITDVTGRKYSIPTYMTSRRINLKLVVQF